MRHVCRTASKQAGISVRRSRPDQLISGKQRYGFLGGSRENALLCRAGHLDFESAVSAQKDEFKAVSIGHFYVR